MKQPLRCFLCEKEGHIKRNCKNYRNDKGSVNNIKSDPDGNIEKHDLFAQEKRCSVIFDTGSDVSIISDSLLKKLNNIKITEIKPAKELTLVNDQIVVVKRVAMTPVCYRNRTFEFGVYVLETGTRDRLIIGTSTIKLLKAK